MTTIPRAETGTKNCVPERRHLRASLLAPRSARPSTLAPCHRTSDLGDRTSPSAACARSSFLEQAAGAGGRSRRQEQAAGAGGRSRRQEQAAGAGRSRQEQAAGAGVRRAARVRGSIADRDVRCSRIDRRGSIVEETTIERANDVDARRRSTRHPLNQPPFAVVVAPHRRKGARRRAAGSGSSHPEPESEPRARALADHSSLDGSSLRTPVARHSKSLSSYPRAP